MVGIISRDATLTLEEWLEVISEVDELVPAPGTVFENVFRGDVEVRPPVAGAARIVLDGAGRGIGAITPSEDFEETGELDVWAPAEQLDAVKKFAEAVAARLQARLEWDE